MRSNQLSNQLSRCLRSMSCDMEVLQWLHYYYYCTYDRRLDSARIKSRRFPPA